jgi:hypothetical protein
MVKELSLLLCQAELNIVALLKNKSWLKTILCVIVKLVCVVWVWSLAK